jgi:hypothetical protein
MGYNFGPPSQLQQNEAAWFYGQQKAKRQRDQRKNTGGSWDFDALVAWLIFAAIFIGYIVLKAIYIAFTSWVASLFWWWPF